MPKEKSSEKPKGDVCTPQQRANTRLWISCWVLGIVFEIIAWVFSWTYWLVWVFNIIAGLLFLFGIIAFIRSCLFRMYFGDIADTVSSTIKSAM